MHIMHLALGGCLKAPPVSYGLTDDTGGHIAYVLGAAREQAQHPSVSRVDIVTRAFTDMGEVYARVEERINSKTVIRRLVTPVQTYLAKQALWDELPALAKALSRMLAQGPRPDLIHAHFADAAEIALQAAAPWKIPVVYTPHSLVLDKQDGAATEPRRAAAECFAIQNAHAVIVSSRDEAERQIAAYDPGAIGRTHRIFPGVGESVLEGTTASARQLIAPWLQEPDRPLLLAIARPVAKKNLTALVRAYKNSAQLQARANLVILAGQHACASAEAKAIITKISQIGVGLEGRFAFPPSHTAAHVAGLYRLAEKSGGVFVNPAFFEPFGLTLLEAAFVGLPVVATRHGGPSAILADIGHGQLVDPTAEDEIADACLSLLEDRTRWQQASDNALRGIATYSWRTYAQQSFAVYESVGKRQPVFAETATRQLLICDIDNTLTGCAEGAQQFKRWTERGQHPFIVATGRSLPEARAVLRQWQLPEPEAFITSVGTEIFLRQEEGLVLWSQFAETIAASWDRDAVSAVLADLPLDWQPAVDQKASKISVFGDAAITRIIRRSLMRAKLSARVVHSHGRLIDILPPAAGKANAIKALASRYGLDLASCIAAGDSGNDFDMLRLCGTAIVVGNASSELSRLPARPQLYRVSRPYAHGVLEGLGRMRAGTPS